MRLLSLIILIYCTSFSYGQNIDWQFTYGGELSDFATSITPSKSGGHIVCGYSNSKDGDVKKGFEGNDYWVFKINKEGVLLWEYKLGGSSDYDFAYDVHENNKEEIIIVGSTFSTDGQRKEKELLGGDDIWITSINKDGKLLWTKTYGGSQEDVPTSSIMNKDGSYVITGYTKSRDKHFKKGNGKHDLIIMKMKKKKGKSSWIHSYGGSKNDLGHAIKATRDGGYIICGETESDDKDVKYKRDKQYDLWVLKLDQKGRIEWQKTMGGSDNDSGKDIIETPEGDFIVVGETESSNGHVDHNNGAYDCWVLKLNSKGRLMWQKTIGGKKVEFGKSVAYNYASGNFYVLGATTSDSSITGKKGSMDFWLIKMDLSGEILSKTAIGGKNIDHPEKILIDKKGNIILLGTTNSNDGNLNNLQRYDNHDIWILKLSDNEILVEMDETKEKGVCITKSYAGGYFFAGINDIKLEKRNTVLSQYDPAGFEMFKKEIKGNGHDTPADIIKAHDGTGGYYLVGTSNSTNGDFKNNRGRKDIFFSKVSGTGDVIYTKVFGGANDDEASNVIKKNKQELYIIGATKSSDKDIKHQHYGDKDIWVINIAKTGKIIWEKNYGGVKSETITKSILNNRKKLVIVGYSNSDNGDILENHGNKDGIMMILGDTGQIEQFQHYGAEGNDWINDIIQTPDGGYIMVGASKSPKIDDGLEGGSDFWVIRTNSSGDIVWEKTYGGTNNDEAMSVTKLSNGNYLVIGRSNSNDKNIKNPKGDYDGWFIIIDDNGKLVNQKNFGSKGHEVLEQAIHINGRKYVAVGYTRDDLFNYKIWIEEFKN